MVSEEEFAVAMIFAILFGLWSAYLLFRNRRLKKRLRLLERAPIIAAPTEPLAPSALPAKDPEIAELKERIKVLERITVEKESSLSREIEQLRHA